MVLPSVVSPYTRSRLPDADQSEKMWKSWIFALVTLLLSLGTGVFLASFFTELPIFVGIPYLLLLVVGGTLLLLWLAFTALSFTLIRVRFLKFFLAILLPVLLWLPLYVAGISMISVGLAVFATLLGLAIGWGRRGFSVAGSLISRPFSESSLIIRWLLIGMAFAIAVLLSPGFSSREPVSPRISLVLAQVFEVGFRSFGLPISRVTTLDDAIESFLETFDNTFRSAPQVIRATLIRSQREFITKMLFSQDTGLTGRETIEELLRRLLVRSNVVVWTLPLLIFSILLIPAVIVRWIAAALSWVLLELLLALGFARIGKELVEREVIILA